MQQFPLAPKQDHLGSSDFIVGSFTSQGKEVKSGKFVGSEEGLQSLREKLTEAALSSGAIYDESTLIDKPEPQQEQVMQEETSQLKKGKSKFNSKPIVQAKLDLPTAIQTVSKKQVMFSTSAGRFKMQVEEIINEPNYFVLIFSEEKDIVFEPATGQLFDISTLTTSPVQVQYLDILFPWIDKTKKIMLLFKKPTPEQEEELNRYV